LTALLDAFRKGVQAVAEYLAKGKLARRPPAALKALCDWRLVALQPGSLRVGIRLPDSSQKQLFEDIAPDVRRATSEFLTVAAWAGEQADLGKLDQHMPDREYRRILLNAVKSFAPRPRGTVERVTVSGQMAPERPIVLTKASSPWIDRAIDRTAEAQVEDHIGDLREIDLDNLTLTMRNVGDVQEVHCQFDPSLLEAAKEALDRRVKVSGVREVGLGRRARTKLNVFRLEVLDDATSETGDIIEESSQGKK
jgi:hypothetical protein